MAMMNSDGAYEPDDVRVDLSVQRTLLASERTLLAWVRTALSLMAAGVAFDKGVRLLHEARVLEGTALVQGAHVVGMTLTGAIVVLLTIVMWNHVRSARAITRIAGPRSSGVTPALLAAGLVVVVGCAALAILRATN
jgi:putative membrane protein